MLNLKYLALALVVGLASCPLLAGQQPAAQPPLCAHILFCLINQKAMASDPTGIHKYSADLIGSTMPNPAGEDSVRQLANHLADRLASAEQAARAGNGRLVPEAAVVKAFNDLMQEIGASPSIRTSEASVRGFREHAASIKAFPAVLSADRNGTNCNPGEAVFLLYLLISDDGVLYERNLDTAQALMQMDFKRNGGGSGFGEGGIIDNFTRGPDAWRLLSSYHSNHGHRATIALFNNLVATLGF
jgi:hypothetical protein